MKSILKRIFDFSNIMDLSENSRPNLSATKGEGRVVFDFETKRSIVQTIPYLLGKILSTMEFNSKLSKDDKTSIRDNMLLMDHIQCL